MPLRSPSQAAQWLRAHARGSLCSDSRRLRPGDAFLAWPGAVRDARAYVAAALQAGASACLVEDQGASAFDLPQQGVARYAGLKADTGAIAAEFFRQPTRELALLAITGTNGKTSCAWWLAQALSAVPGGVPCAMVGTLGLGRPPALPGERPARSAAALESSGLTTPDPVLLQRSLRAWVDEGVRACAIEASSIGLQEGRLNGCAVDTALFTNFTQDHLDYHGDMAAYWQAKRRLFDWPGLRCAVLNVDDAHGAALAAELQGSALDVWTYAQGAPARLVATRVTLHSDAIAFEVCEAGGQSLPLRCALLGAFNVSNVLAVIAVLRSQGVALADAVQVCAALQPVPGRMQCLGGKDAPLVAIDYAHTPDALQQALRALRPLAQQRSGALWCVFGCGGARDAGKRPQMGAVALQDADRVLLTSDNPRDEAPQAIADAILAGMPSPVPAQVALQLDRALALAQCIADADARDVILIAGKGHEQTQEVAGTHTPFSDSAHASAALAQRAARAAALQGGHA